MILLEDVFSIVADYIQAGVEIDERKLAAEFVAKVVKNDLLEERSYVCPFCDGSTVPMNASAKHTLDVCLECGRPLLPRGVNIEELETVWKNYVKKDFLPIEEAVKIVNSGIKRDGASGDGRTGQRLITPSLDRVKTHGCWLEGATKDGPTACEKLYVTINNLPTKEIIETFMEMSPEGGCGDIMLNNVAILMSLYLQEDGSHSSGERIKRYIKLNSGVNCLKSSIARPSCIKVFIGLLQERLEILNGKSDTRSQQAMTGQESFCPDCSSVIMFVEGCKKCSNPGCGWSKC